MNRIALTVLIPDRLMPNTTVGKIVATGGGVAAGIGAGASWGLALGPWGAAVGASDVLVGHCFAH